MKFVRRVYAIFHRNLLTKTMAIGVILAVLACACLIQLTNVQLVKGKDMAQAAAQSRWCSCGLSSRSTI